MIPPGPDDTVTLDPYSRYAEALTVELVRRSNLSVAFSHARLVRLRGDLRTPDVDNASTIGAMRRVRNEAHLGGRPRAMLPSTSSGNRAPHTNRLIGRGRP